MNAVPPIPQAQPLIDAAQPDASASASSASTRVGSQDFAAALNDAGGKPARKSAANKPQDSSASGVALPPPGNQPPLAPTPPPPAKTDVAAVSGAPPAVSTAAVADAAAILKGAQGGAQGLPPNGVDTAPKAPGNAAGATTILASANLDPAAPPAVGALPAVAAAPGIAVSPPPPGINLDAGAPSSADGPTATGSGLTMPHAASMRTLATPGTSTAAAAPQLRAGSARTAQSSDATAKQGTVTSANAAPSSADANALNDSNLNNGPAASGTDAATQAVMAAAIAQGTSAPAPDSSAVDDSASPETVAQGATILSDPAAGDPATALARAAAASISAAATSAMVTAATAASVARAVSAAAGANAADKRSHGDSPDATLSGASNDGSAGAAQLLTSNTSSDSAPTPTFKIAAGVDTAQFGQGVADRVALMMDGNLTSAKLQVNPPALGPIEVRIALQGGHAQISLSSHSAVTRDALEASSSKLREMLGSQGFSQVSVDISQRSFQERLPQSQAYESASGGDAPVLVQAPLSISRSASGLLDAYA
jgi:flagellar hook-length control protein FliK